MSTGDEPMRACRCGYDLTQLVRRGVATCPECGGSIPACLKADERDVFDGTALRDRRSSRVWIAVALALAAGMIVLVVWMFSRLDV